MRRLIFLFCLLACSFVSCSATRSVVDETGQKVVVPDHPHRIICLVPSITDSVFSLGAGDDVVAVSNYVEFPVAAQKEPSVGSIMTPSLEVIVPLHPDLLLGIPKANSPATLAQLGQLAIPVFLYSP